MTSAREVTSPVGIALTAAFSAVYLWRAWQRTAAVRADVVWRMCAVAFAWNSIAVLSGSRRVLPVEQTMAFVLYDTVFEVAFLYAGLAESSLLVARNVGLLPRA